MNKKGGIATILIGLLVFAALVGGGFFLISKLRGKNLGETIATSDYSVFVPVLVKDDDTGELLKANITVFEWNTDVQLYKWVPVSTTAELLKIPIRKPPTNITLFIYPRVRGYYIGKHIFPTNIPFNDITLEMSLEVPAVKAATELNATLAPWRLVAGSNEYLLSLTPNGQYRNPMICYKWSVAISSVSLLNGSKTSLPGRLSKDRLISCDAIHTLEAGQQRNYTLSIKTINLNPDDYVEFVVLDRDKLPIEGKSEWGLVSAEDENGKNNGGPDYVYRFNDEGLKLTKVLEP